jgi:hypothetical protein
VADPIPQRSEGISLGFCISLTDEAIDGTIRFIAKDVVRTPFV